MEQDRPERRGRRSRTGPPSLPVTLTVCSVLRDEGRYLLERLAFHRAAGVERFLLYDHGSRDDTQALAARFERCFPGTVTLVPWRHWRRPQLAGFDDGLRRLRGRTEWAAFIDGDEYLFGVDEDLRDILADFAAVDGVAAHWLIFGSAGLAEPPPGLGLESFTRCAAPRSRTRHVFKSIVRPERARGFPHPHRPRLDGPMVNEGGHPVPPGASRVPTGSCDRLRLNHYPVRSRAEWAAKQRRGLPFRRWFRQARRADGFYAQYDRNEREDRAAWRLLPAVREMLARLERC